MTRKPDGPHSRSAQTDPFHESNSGSTPHSQSLCILTDRTTDTILVHNPPCPHVGCSWTSPPTGPSWLASSGHAWLTVWPSHPPFHTAMYDVNWRVKMAWPPRAHESKRPVPQNNTTCFLISALAIFRITSAIQTHSSSSSPQDESSTVHATTLWPSFLHCHRIELTF